MTPTVHLLLVALALAHSGCAIHFTNAQSRVEPEFRRVYVPAATDSATAGGTAARVSLAVRRQLASNTRFLLVGSDEARWGIDMRVKERSPSVETVEACTPADRTIGAGAFACDENNLDRPLKVADREGLGIEVAVVAIDLKTGKKLGERTVVVRPNENTFPVIAEREGDGARVRSGLARTPDMHALRYLENVDAATDSAAAKAAAQIIAMMEALTASR